MSTNDTVVLLASGASGVVPSAETSATASPQVCADLARKLIGDAEGASHDIAIRTFNAATERDAETVSRAVARSNLFKAAIFGNDPNWGRVLSAVGTTDAAFEPDQLNVVHERRPDLPATAASARTASWWTWSRAKCSWRSTCRPAKRKPPS